MGPATIILKIGINVVGALIARYFLRHCTPVPSWDHFATRRAFRVGLGWCVMIGVPMVGCRIVSTHAAVVLLHEQRPAWWQSMTMVMLLALLAGAVVHARRERETPERMNRPRSLPTAKDHRA